MFRMSRIVRHQQSIRRSITVRLSAKRKIAALAAVLGCAMLAIYGIANLAKSSAKSAAPATLKRRLRRWHRAGSMRC